jgi:hypothetical protein
LVGASPRAKMIFDDDGMMDDDDANGQCRCDLNFLTFSTKTSTTLCTIE